MRLNTEALKAILELKEPEHIKRFLIIEELAKDDKLIIELLQALEEIRSRRELLLRDTNDELSRALVALEKGNKIVSHKWVAGEIRAHYKRNKKQITNTVNINIE